MKDESPKNPEAKVQPEQRAAGEKGKSHGIFLNKELYELCPICQGCKIIPQGVSGMADGVKTPEGKTYTGPLKPGMLCPECQEGGTGFTKIGMTVGQLEKIRASYEMLLRLVVGISEGCYPADQINDRIQTALSVLPKSDVSAARFRLEQAKRIFPVPPIENPAGNAPAG